MPTPPHPLLRTIGHTIRTYRLDRGLSQESLADRANIDRSYMSGIERGLRNISILNIARIASALDVSIRDLVGQVELVRRLDEAGDVSFSETLTSRRRIPTAPAEEWEPGRYLSLGAPACPGSRRHSSSVSRIAHRY
jgi:transcriptional regulator with XRE-family HTH domain